MGVLRSVCLVLLALPVVACPFRLVTTTRGRWTELSNLYSVTIRICSIHPLANFRTFVMVFSSSSGYHLPLLDTGLSSVLNFWRRSLPKLVSVYSSYNHLVSCGDTLRLLKTPSVLGFFCRSSKSVSAIVEPDSDTSTVLVRHINALCRLFHKVHYWFLAGCQFLYQVLLWCLKFLSTCFLEVLSCYRYLVGIVRSLTAVCSFYLVLDPSYGAMTLVSPSLWQYEGILFLMLPPVNLLTMGLCYPDASLMKLFLFPIVSPKWSSLEVQPLLVLQGSSSSWQLVLSAFDAVLMTLWVILDTTFHEIYSIVAFQLLVGSSFELYQQIIFPLLSFMFVSASDGFDVSSFGGVELL